MSDEYGRELNFDSDTFEQMKQDMNFVLQRLLGRMIESDTEQGSMTINIGVAFNKEVIPNFDPNIEGESREIRKPVFAHKVTSSIKINEEKKGNLDSEMELVFDEETGKYKMVPIADTDQRSIFDADFREVSEEEQEEDPDGSAIEGREQAALPGPSDYEYDSPTD